MSEPAKQLDTARPVKPVEDAPAANDAPPKVPAVQDLRRRRARRLAIRLALAVGLPTVLAGVYYGAVCTRSYESTASFTIQSADSNMAPTLDLLLGSVPGGGAAGRDVRLVQEYILSRSMLRYLEDEHGFVEHYSQEHIDWLSRLPPDAPLEDRFDYYQKVVGAEFDTESGALTLSVRAFDADTARKLADAVLSASERMVNRMMTEARQDRLELARREVTSAEQRLTEARNQLRALQTDRSQLDPRAQAQATMHVKSSLEAQLAEARAELSTLRANLHPGAPQLLAQQQKVKALHGQIAAQERRLTNRGDEGLDSDLAAFEPAFVEKEIAERTYESAVKSLEMARIEADRQHRYLVTIATPSQPDAPTHPRLFLAILTVLILSFAFFGIGSLIVASVREHANL